MILILFTWFYMFFVFFVQGECINSLVFKGKLRSIGEPILLGMVFQAIFVTIIAFFTRIHIEYFCANILFTIILAFFNRNALYSRLKTLFRWDRFCIVLFFVIVFLSLVRSSLLPFIIDNESYYIQTIKWLNEYGWVKGLANLHVFLSHGSPWHALQAAYNFNFIYDKFNDINGFLVCIAALLWVDKINESRKKSDYITNRWLYFLPVFSIVWFFFVDSPSTDLPLFFISLVVIYHVLNRTKEGDLLAILLSVFLIFIKISIIPILVLTICLLSKKNWKIALSYVIILGGIYIAKGIWLAGYPLTPYPGLLVPLPWTVPIEMYAVSGGDNFNFKVFFDNDWEDIFIFFVILSTFIAYALLVLKKKAQYPILFFFIAEWLLILFTYTQFRYMLPALFYPLSFLLAKIKISPKYLFIMVYCFILAVLAPVFIPYGRTKVFDQETLKVKGFHKEIFLEPMNISRFENLTFEEEFCVNFEFYTPTDTTMYYTIYTTGNGPIPCVQIDYLISMYRRTGRLPALIGDDLSNGFTNVLVEEEGNE